MIRGYCLWIDHIDTRRSYFPVPSPKARHYGRKMYGAKIRKHNLNTLCFSPHGIMLKEVERIFYSQFREPRTYLKIINLLKNGIFSLSEISSKTKIPFIACFTVL